MRNGQSPDLEMRVRTAAEHGKTRLSFILHSPSGVVPFSHREIDGPLLQRNPEGYQGHLLGQIEKLGEGLDIDRSLLLQAEVESKLESLGRDLWRELFPPELRSAYRDVIRATPAVHSWVIVSDEPWIPWELVKPYDDGRPGELLDDDFLCLRFEVTRWLAGERPFVPEITIRSMAVVQTADLPHAPRERKLFKHLKEEFPGLSSEVPPLESAADLPGFLLSTDVGLVHLIGHGTPMAMHPDESGLPFPDQSVLRPGDLHGPLATHLSRRRPMVFLNACWAGRKGWSLTRLGGWAARWIGPCGCSAFIAPLWPVRDEAAVSFAWAFYEALAEGATLGQAALKARRQVHQEHPGDPSALAYTVYGHPNARVLFLDASAAEDEAENSGARRTRPNAWIPPRRHRWRRWIQTTAGALGFATCLHFATAPILDFYFPTDQPPAAPLKLPERSRPTPRSKPSTAPPHSGTASSKVGGLAFKVSGGQSSLHGPMNGALRRAAGPLIEEGISGWTISVRLEPPEISPIVQGDHTLQSCRLSGQATAHGPASLDLGTVGNVNAQFNGSKACEAATGPLATAVLTRFAAALPT